MPHTKIAQNFLDNQSSAIFSGDLGAYLKSLALPCRRQTLTHDSLVETEQQVTEGLEAYRRMLTSHHVNLFYRRIRKVRQLSKRYIDMIYICHYLKDATHVIPPYEGRSVIALSGDTWRMIENERLLNTAGPSAYIQTIVPVDAGQISFPEFDIRCQDLDPLVTYQSYLDQRTQSEQECDFDAFLALTNLPHHVHYASYDSRVDDTERLRTFFDAIQKMHNGEVGDQTARRAEKAEFVGPDMLVGYHSTHVSKNGMPVSAPVSSRMILKLTETGWKLVSVSNAIENETYAFDMHVPGEELMTDIDIQKRTKEWPSLQRRRTQTASM